ncbi:MAG: DNA polymerase III subunit gamma/tau [Chloroflexi bacterium]|nr:DNA polymerase III subunit gamma/tau [Chloroflexota bacterium]
MTSQVYYRRWRPDSFSQLVGQEHVSTTLRQAIKQGRVSHSYLFCGPRGSGKTTTARIVAKAINCLDLQDGDPCNACSICLTINQGQFLDIIELDAASNRGIDEIRDIRDKVNFSPVQGRRKAYIIDEAHMLTDQASNAFLKTLEEPPDHVIFILCTTEIHKILPTIISRCQRFDFRRIPSDLIKGRLEEIIEAEGALVEPDALRLISRYAAGSLRDAENLLEQLVVSYGEGVGLTQVEELLGLGHGDRWLELVRHLLMGNTSTSLTVINQAAWDGVDLRQLHRQTLELLRSAMLMRWGSSELLDLPEHVAGQLQDMVGQLPPWRIVRALKLWGDVNMRYDAPSTLPLELAAVEICDDQVSAPGTADQPQAVATQSRAAAPRRSADAAPANPRPTAAPAQPPAQSPAQSPQRSPAAPAPVASNPVAPAASGDGDLASRWAAMVKVLGRQKGNKYNLGALLRDCKADAIVLDGDTLVMAFSHRANMERMQEEMEDPRGRALVADAVVQFFGASSNFTLTLVGENGGGGNNVRPSQNSPLVRAALGMGARIIDEVPL